MGVAVLSLLSACQTRPDFQQSRSGPQVKAGLILLTPEQAERKGLQAAAEGTVPSVAEGLRTDGVLRPAELSAYSIGRYVDPEDPDLLHEAHLVYRREAGEAWVLQPPPNAALQIGPRLAPPSVGASVGSSAEIEAAVSDLRRQLREERETREQLLKWLEAKTEKGKLKEDK